MNKNKKLSTLLSIISFSIVGIGSIAGSMSPIPNGNSYEVLNNDVQNVLLQTTQNHGYSVKDNVQPTNKDPEDITPQELQSVLNKPTDVVGFTVTILPITEQNIAQGSIDFLIYEIKSDNGSYVTSLASAGDKKSNNTIDENVLNKYSSTINGKTANATQTNVFNTITSFDKSDSSQTHPLEDWLNKKSFEVKWRSDEEIEKYIKNKDTPGLTEEDVWNNLIDNSSLPPLSITKNNNPSTMINVEENTTYTNVGLYDITITINNGQKSELNKKTLGGFLTSDNKRHIPELKFNSSVSDFGVKKENVDNFGLTTLFNNGDSLISENGKVKDLTASEFASPLGGEKNLIKVLTNSFGLNTNEKIIQLLYGNKLYELNKQTNSLTNSANIFENASISSIKAVPVDSKGSLQLVIEYEAFDVYSGKNKKHFTTYTFPENTFKINPNADKNLFVTWKNVESLQNMNYSYEVVNEYYKNKDDEEFARLFSNRFIDASQDVQDMKRTVEIDYFYTSGYESNGEWLSSTSDNTLKIKLTFESWGTSSEAFSMEKVFKFSGYKYESPTNGPDDTLNFKWKSNEETFATNLSFSELSPSDVALSLVTTEASVPGTIYSTFILGNTNASKNMEISLQPNDADGTIMVYVRRKTEDNNVIGQNIHIYQQLYAGFKKTPGVTSSISFSFLPQSEVSPALLAIPVEQVKKKDVIDLYLNNIPLFKNKILTDDDVEIIPQVSENGTATLKVIVTISEFNQSVPGFDSDKQKFYTIIKGFSSMETKNFTKFNPPKDLTVVISITSAVIISVTLGIVLISMLIQRGRIKNIKMHDELLLKNKKTKK